MGWDVCAAVSETSPTGCALAGPRFRKQLLAKRTPGRQCFRTMKSFFVGKYEGTWFIQTIFSALTLCFGYVNPELGLPWQIFGQALEALALTSVLKTCFLVKRYCQLVGFNRRQDFGIERGLGSAALPPGHLHDVLGLDANSPRSLKSKCRVSFNFDANPAH